MNRKDLTLGWFINAVIEKVGKNTPDFLSRLLVNIPFKFRFGNAYSDFEEKLREVEKWNEKELESYIVSNFDKIFQHSKRFKLYKDKYEKSGVLNLVVKNLEDIKKVPILTRNEVRENILEFNGNYFAKTGGTTGNPLPLYLDESAWAREWAHYHYIWKKEGYKHTDVKFAFRDLDSKFEFLKYDYSHNAYYINVYKIYKINRNNIDDFFKILAIRNVRYFHGYPSAINDFLKEIEGRITRDQKEKLKQQIECCFYNSEYPTRQITDYLKREWGLDFISMYGHTEMCILATTDRNKSEYHPLHTYGYVEVEDNMLLGTSYHNFDMPLIRYNTDDLVKPKRYANGILESFKIEQGRNLDIIIDKNNFRIVLIVFVNSTNYRIFNYVDYIQVFQEKKGCATIIVSQKEGDYIDAQSLMKLEGYDIDFDFLYLRRPIRTMSGKVPLRVKKLP